MDTIDLNKTFFGEANPIYTENYTNGPITGLISKILPNVYVAIGLILFFYLLAGGFMVVSASGNQHNLDQGKQIITNAIIGFIVVFASYWLIQMIQIVTGVQIFNFTL
jgi:hypothetical protein